MGLGHTLWQGLCEAVPFFFCSSCGAWMEIKSKLLASTCCRHTSGAGETVLRKALDECRHPKSDKQLDDRPLRYRYDEEQHGPSQHTFKVRRLARRKVREIAPWQEVVADRVEAPVPGDGYPEGPEDLAAAEEMSQFLALDAFDHGLDDFFGPSAPVVVTDSVSLDIAPPPLVSAEQAVRIAEKRADAIVKRDARRKRTAANKAAALAKRAARQPPSVQQQAVALRRKAKADAKARGPGQASRDDVLVSDSSDDEPRLASAPTRLPAASAASSSVTPPAGSGAASPAALAAAEVGSGLGAVDLIGSSGPHPESGSSAEIQGRSNATQPFEGPASAAAVVCPAPAAAVRPKAKTRSALPPRGLFGFVAKALGVSASTSPACTKSAASSSVAAAPLDPDRLAIEHDNPGEGGASSSDGESSTVEVLPLGPGAVPTEWEASFQACQQDDNGSLAAAQPSAAVAEFQSDLSSEDLTTLLELHEIGEAVLFPPGLDARVARLVLLARSRQRD